jgi:hypothetical protein
MLSYPHHEDLWVIGDVAPPFFTLALDGDKWTASRLGRFNPRKIIPGSHWIGGWVEPRAC